MAGGLFVKLGLGIARGVGKLITKIKDKKIAKAEKKEAAATAKREAVEATFAKLGLGGKGGTNTNTPLSDVQKAVFGDKSEEVKPSETIMQWIKDNWKLAVPSIVGITIGFVVLIWKLFKKRR